MVGTSGGIGENQVTTEGALPNVVIVGAQKCGTTSLYNYLSLHPEVSMSVPKELNFFIGRRNWSRGVEWYKRHFDPEAGIRGEASPMYTADPAFRGAAKRMHRIIPEAKLIYMVRDPLARIRSQWIHNYARQNTSLPLHEAAIKPAYLSRSRYGHQLTKLLEFYPPERILIVDQQDLLHRRREELRRIFSYIGADPDFWDEEGFGEERLQSKGRRRRTKTEVLVASHWPRLASALFRNRIMRRRFRHTQIDDELRRKLDERLADDIARFRELTGMAFEGWSI